MLQNLLLNLPPQTVATYRNATLVSIRWSAIMEARLPGRSREGVKKRASDTVAL